MKISPPVLGFRSSHTMIQRDGHSFKQSSVLWLCDWRKPGNLTSFTSPSALLRVAFLLFNFGVFGSLTVDIHFWTSHLFSLCNQWKELDICHSSHLKITPVCLFYCSANMMTPTTGIIFHWVFNSHLQLLVGRLLKKEILFLSSTCVLLYSELLLLYQFSQGETLNYTCKLFADDVQQTKEEKEIGSHLNDCLQCLLK